MHFITEEELLWIMTRIINVLMLDLFLLQMLTDGLECCDVFILTAPIHFHC